MADGKMCQGEWIMSVNTVGIIGGGTMGSGIAIVTAKLGYNMSIGPLELADRIGLDTLLNFMTHLFRETGDSKFRPCPLLKKLVRGEHFGVKTGEGFFKYDLETGKRDAFPVYKEFW
jgi:3-hydroxybutyryl-CoA dehydrogenase